MTQPLQLSSENCEAGFELLITKNDSSLNEALSDLIQSTVRSKYFEEVSDQKEVDKGLEILAVLLPNLTGVVLSKILMVWRILPISPVWICVGLETPNQHHHLKL
jgi:hypothetical protein